MYQAPQVQGINTVVLALLMKAMEQTGCKLASHSLLPGAAGNRPLLAIIDPLYPLKSLIADFTVPWPDPISCGREIQHEYESKYRTT